jgi:hypothetical protein
MHELRGEREPNAGGADRHAVALRPGAGGGLQDQRPDPQAGGVSARAWQAADPSEHPNIVAVASDAPVETTLPVLDINDPDAIVEFIVASGV